MTTRDKMKLLADYQSFVGTIDERFDDLDDATLGKLREQLTTLYQITDRRQKERRERNVSFRD